jgi:cob(I)alamin adenosyltransferase
MSPEQTQPESSGGNEAGKRLMDLIDEQVSHIWMVRCFLKHCDEAEDDEELASVHRDLYDFMLALGPALQEQDEAAYLKFVKKKLSKLRRATELFMEIQPEVSGHMNFQMAARSLRLAVDEIQRFIAK